MSLSPIEQVIAATASARGGDWRLAVATGRVEAPSFLATGDQNAARGDPSSDHRAINGFCSFGPFQENVCGGAGETHINHGGTFADFFDPVSATIRFLDRAKGLSGTPGQIAADAQRPANPIDYAAKVDAQYVVLGGDSVTAPPQATLPAIVPAVNSTNPLRNFGFPKIPLFDFGSLNVNFPGGSINAPLKGELDTSGFFKVVITFVAIGIIFFAVIKIVGADDAIAKVEGAATKAAVMAK